jgi:hypothetical protein
LVGAAASELTTLSPPNSGFFNDLKGQFPVSRGDQLMRADAGGGVLVTDVAMVGTFGGTVIGCVA